MFAIIIILIFTFVLNGTLTLLVSRRRSKIAMWVSIALFALGLSVFLVQSTINGLLGLDGILSALQSICQGVAYGLLFTPSARRWMRREDKLLDIFH
jgi:putative flippase GtrA